MNNWVTIITNIILVCITAYYALQTKKQVDISNNNIKEVQKQVELSQKNIEQTKKSIEHMEDALIPVVSIEISCSPTQAFSTSNMYSSIDITIINCGNGPAFIKEITTRCELSQFGKLSYEDECRYISSIIIGKNNKETIKNIKFTQMFDNFKEESPILSSLSVWYEDVYGKLYRSRVIYKYEKSNIDLLFSEFIKFTKEESELPTDIKIDGISYFNPSENGLPIHYNEETLFLQRLIDIQNATDKNYKVGEKSIYLSDINYWQNEYPTFLCRIENNESFVIYKNIKRDNNGIPIYTYHIKDGEEYPKLRQRINPCQRLYINHKDSEIEKGLSKYGLKLEQDKKDIYEGLFNKIKQFSKENRIIIL